MIPFFRNSYEELETWVNKNVGEKYRLGQIINAFYKNFKSSPDDTSNLPKNLRQLLIESFDFNTLTLVNQIHSKDEETHKLLFQTKDDNYLESVIIESPSHVTLCVSSQIGCKVKCQYCATGTMRIHRNLEINEIIEQVVYAHRLGYKIKNIVFMGMGEPLLNLNEFLGAYDILLDKNLFAYGKRRVTISTSGIIKSIEYLLKEGIDISMSLSLGSAIEEKRNRLIPIGKSNRLDQLIKVLKDYQNFNHKIFTFEYVLVKDYNHFEEDVKALVNLRNNLNFDLNIIPLNTFDGCTLERPTTEQIKKFIASCEKSGLNVTQRYQKGSDILASCGQLAAQK